MKITREEVEHIAHLAHLGFSSEELDQYGFQLEAVLGYIDRLQEVDTASVSADLEIKELSNVWREDKAIDWDKEEVSSALKSGEQENGNIKVKKIL